MFTVTSTNTTRHRHPARPLKRLALVCASAVLALGAISGPAGATETKKPVPAPTSTAAPATSGPVNVAYVEVNSNEFKNVARYTLAGTTRPAFDIGVIFAANINWDGQKAYLHLNDQVTSTLNNAATQIRPVQARGTKVLLSILGNHQGAGIANFQSYAAADAFAAELENVVETYGLDGIDFDDEWSQYGVNGTAQPNDYSFVYLVQALRERLGDDKLITFYNIGPAMNSLEYGGVRVGDLIDYAWNPYYSTWQTPSIPGLAQNQLGAGAVDLQNTPQATAANFAQQTVSQGLGALITYDLRATNQASYISAITTPLKGLATVYQ